MVYKKIELVPGKITVAPKSTKTFCAIKNAYTAIKKDFANGTNNMAEGWVKSSPQLKGQKVRKLKEGTFHMAKTMAADIKKNMKGVSPKAAICDLSYEIGGVLKKTKDVIDDYIDEITRIPNGK